ncbi:MAG: hydroxymethylbilane synthase, partial [Candidatus Accumulibacter sp.]|nr:hydroxymethylbilane synthase [Accumulibacter sp.]
GIETLRARDDVRGWLAAIDDGATHAAVSAERALLAALGAGCRSPVGALATIDGDTVTLRAEILTEDGSECVADRITLAGGDAGGAAALARTLLDRATPALRGLFTG